MTGLFEDGNRVLAGITKVREVLASGQKGDGSGPIEPQALIDLEATLAVDPGDHVAYQNAQARGHALGHLTTAEAQTIYVALGEVGSPENGGWAAGTDLATKVVVTEWIGRLLGVR